MKVLITIGTMRDLSFTRLFKIIDELCEEGILDGEKVLAQIGAEPYKPRHFHSFEMATDEAFKEYIQESDFIITHAGTGTVTSCLKQGKKVIIFPRFAKYQEHYDDHQLELAEIFTEKKYALAATDKNELRNCIQMIDLFNPEPFVSNNNRMNQLVKGFIEQHGSTEIKKSFFSFKNKTHIY